MQDHEVLPAMAIGPDVDTGWLKDRIYSFLESVFKRENDLIKGIGDCLSVHPDMDREQMDGFLSEFPGGSEGVARGICG